jgi:hypothetical protein
MNNRCFISDSVTCNARSELYITDVSMQTQNMQSFFCNIHTLSCPFSCQHTTHTFCFIFAVKVARDVKDVLEDCVRHGNVSYA